MKAVQYADGQVQTVEVDSPKAVEPRQVVVKTASAGICGSDLHLVDLGLIPPEVTIGHEFAGFLPDGSLAAIEPITPCGSCPSCIEDRYNLCPDAIGTVSGMGSDGGMAEEVLVNESQIVPMASGADPSSACLMEPLAVCVHGFRRIGLKSDMRVLIIGGGTIGQCALAVAANAGAETVLRARHESQIAAADRLGSAEFSDEPYDLVVDAAGTTEALKDAVSLARPGAKMLLLATYWSGMELPGTEICMKEVDIVPAIMYSRNEQGRDSDEAAAILAANPQIAEAIITHRFPLDAAPEAFAAAQDRSAGAIKVIFDPTL